MPVDKSLQECRTFGKEDMKSFCKMSELGLRFVSEPSARFLRARCGKICLAVQASLTIVFIARLTTTSCIPLPATER